MTNEEFDTTADILQEGPEVLRSDVVPTKGDQALAEQQGKGQTFQDSRNGRTYEFDEENNAFRAYPANALLRSDSTFDVVYSSGDLGDTARVFNSVGESLDENTYLATDYNEPGQADAEKLFGLVDSKKDAHWVHISGGEEIEEAVENTLHEYGLEGSAPMPDNLKRELDQEFQESNGYWVSQPR